MNKVEQHHEPVLSWEMSVRKTFLLGRSLTAEGG